MDNVAIKTGDFREPVPSNRNKRILKFLYNLGLTWANGEDRRLIHCDTARFFYVSDNRITYSSKWEPRFIRNRKIADMTSISNEPLTAEELK